METLPGRILLTRKRLGIKGKDVAEALGISPSLYSKIESGKRRLTAENIPVIAKVLGCSIEYLFDKKLVASTLDTELRIESPLESTTADNSTSGKTSAKLEAMREELMTRLTAALQPELEKVISRLAPLADDFLDNKALADPAMSAKGQEQPAAGHIEVRKLAAVAGEGAGVLDETVTGYVVFRQDWLTKKGLDAAQCCVIGVRGESMEATLPDGCSILVNCAQRRRWDGRIYVVHTDEGLVVKRAGKDKNGKWQLLSDHPSWKPTPWAQGTEVIGEVRWMGRTFR